MLGVVQAEPRLAEKSVLVEFMEKNVAFCGKGANIRQASLVCDWADEQYLLMKCHVRGFPIGMQGVNCA
ncbi:hypothetical protein GCM10007418_31760 [Halopseudomonas salina]|uniref:Uncharacterized protein n=1 Tax=Halopseudomonas salina TaxID=1323744 RepID=A0ABQ1Q1T3_9GAMM|nr:hypothetical protein GCM10007418_31760 [Halopseudomonas salina]